MSVAVNFELFGQEGVEKNYGCSVVSIYEDMAGRDLLVQLCKSLSSKFKDDLQFHFDWWRFKFLEDPEIGMEAAHSAAHADLILLAPKSADLPIYVQGWFEGWLPSRTPDNGALVLVQPSSRAKSQPGMRSYLRQTAKRAHLDYLSLESPGAGKGFLWSQPELNELLYQGGHGHWGINE